MAPAQPPICSVCSKGSAEVQLQQCSRCKSRYYCGRECQVSDWQTHKVTCGKPGSNRASGSTSSGPKWYDKHRKCRDGHNHEGDLELITWNCPKEKTGWGAVCLEEADDLKHRFETEMGGDLQKLYEEWPDAFRWTCCGTSAGMDHGCDHHGSGSFPCSCDFCRMGKPLPERIYKEKSAERMGLNLRRGPDPRSFNPALAALCATGRSICGLEM
ncbi:putative MYND finger [Lyophyllum shimeji]|uniref:MYND finger n=1 Tax=Lyophyllum shimeji TaxID=47721 RepID=A0A9P3UQ85_LYOSH|nr:putative MYND finger [Lyophyllum shimeji]